MILQAGAPERQARSTSVSRGDGRLCAARPSPCADGSSTLFCGRFDKQTGLLYPSKAEFERKPSPLTTLVLKVLSTLGLIEVSVNSETGRTETTNLTILNVFLVRLGPMREDTLVKVLICAQVTCLGNLCLLAYAHTCPLFRLLEAWSLLVFGTA